MSATRYILNPRPGPSLLSLVIPAYNEEAVVPVLRGQLSAFLDRLPCPVEVIFVDDGSADRTLELLVDWAREDSRIKVLGLARNFGHQAAVTAGLDAAGGDATVIIDADLQDPLDVIFEMLDRYRDGYDVVYGQRISRDGETLFKRMTAWGFYRFMRAFIHKDLPPDSGDFRLVSRPCLDAVKSMRETHRFLRGMVAWVGFPQTAVKYKRAARVAGTTKYPLVKMVRFAWNAAVSFSPAPMRLSLGGGVVLAILGLIYLAYAIGRALIVHDTERGWTSQVAITLVIGGAILVSIGILGEYVGKIFEEIKGRPLYLVSSRVNIEPARDGGDPMAANGIAPGNADAAPFDVAAATAPRDAGSNGANGEAPIAAGMPAAVSVTVTDYARNARIAQDVPAARRGAAEQGAR